MYTSGVILQWSFNQLTIKVKLKMNRKLFTSTIGILITGNGGKRT